MRYGEQLKDAIPKASKRTSGSGPGTTLAACLAKSMEREVLSEMVPWSLRAKRARHGKERFSFPMGLPNVWISGWWFQIFFMFTPTWGDDPI